MSSGRKNRRTDKGCFTSTKTICPGTLKRSLFRKVLTGAFLFFYKCFDLICNQCRLITFQNKEVSCFCHFYKQVCSCTLYRVPSFDSELVKSFSVFRIIYFFQCRCDTRTADLFFL